MKTLKVLLALITEDNDYQREQASVGEKTAQRLGIQLKVVFANSDAIAQTQQVLAAIHAAAPDRPDAVIVEPVGTGMPQVASAAAHGGVGWIVLNREADYLVPLRGTTSIPIGSVDCDNLEVGRIQGRQYGALLPGGGTVLYVEGPSADVAKQRRAGMEETRPAGIEISAVRGKWTEESGYQAVSARLQLHGSRPPNVSLIGCQNDAMAMGARRAVEALAAPEQREAWLKVPFLGVDGVPTSGQVWVRNGQLAATIITPALSGIALELVARSLASGTQIPERTLTRPVSFPPVEELKPVAAPAEQ
jgi:ribose transport system substrate-binding protein